jgi:hypothetical protein
MTPAKHPADRTAMMVDRIAEIVGSDEEVATALGIAPVLPAEWRLGREPSDSEWDRLVDLYAVIEKLEGYYTPGRIRSWLEGGNAHLGGRAPLYLIRNGATGAVYDAIRATKAGAFA